MSGAELWQPESSHAKPDRRDAGGTPDPGRSARLSRAQAAEMLGLSEVYLRVMLKRGDIRSVKGRALARS